MYKFLTKNGQLIAFGLGALITLIFLGIAFSGLDEFNSLVSMKKGQETNIFNFGLSASLFLTALCFLLMLGFGVYQVATHFKSSVKGLIGFAVIIIIFIVASKMGPTSIEEIHPYVAEPMKKYEVTMGQYGLISGGIMTAIVLSIGALLAFVGSEILNFFK